MKEIIFYKISLYIFLYIPHGSDERGESAFDVQKR